MLDLLDQLVNKVTGCYGKHERSRDTSMGDDPPVLADKLLAADGAIEAQPASRILRSETGRSGAAVEDGTAFPLSDLGRAGTGQLRHAVGGRWRTTWSRLLVLVGNLGFYWPPK